MALVDYIPATACNVVGSITVKFWSSSGHVTVRTETCSPNRDPLGPSENDFASASFVVPSWIRQHPPRILSSFG
ncbi:hypothetical protein K0M31_013516 [Melipona bicolor]|uniref:Uncharacterized protein n=1 Tax=Melipona bicolor TaxID=60889 RepID=A0AA40KGF9_9HYME|nr:hypothetical protein K0M31_013516 [Melipona bicolor]